MRDQHQLPAAGPVEGADHDVGSGAARRLAPLGLRSQRLQPRLGEIGHLRKPFDVGAPGLDHHHVAQRIDQGRLGRFGSRPQLLVGRGENG
jgi:hypothetical protein